MIRLLLDENLSEAILRTISSIYPGSAHVRLALRPGASDEEVWAFARDHGFVLVTRDEDFERLSAMRGAPPKVVWLALHNAINAEVGTPARTRSSPRTWRPSSPASRTTTPARRCHASSCASCTTS